MKMRTLFMSPVPVFSLWISALSFFVAMMSSSWMIDRDHKAHLVTLARDHVAALESARYEGYSSGFDACFTAIGADVGEGKKITFQFDPNKIITVPDGYILTFNKQGWAVLEREKKEENSEKGE